MNEAQGPAAGLQESLVGWTHLIYALHAFSLLTGILGAATVIGAFLTGWPSIVAVILNYVKRADTRGTWLESHFRWQIRTFWFGLLWVSLCIAFVVLTLGIGLIVACSRSSRSASGWFTVSCAAGCGFATAARCMCNPPQDAVGVAPPAALIFRPVAP